MKTEAKIKGYIADVILMDDYVCAYLSVFDGVPQNKNAIICSEEDANKAMEFAKQAFAKFISELGEMRGKDIVDKKSKV